MHRQHRRAGRGDRRHRRRDDRGSRRRLRVGLRLRRRHRRRGSYRRHHRRDDRHRLAHRDVHRGRVADHRDHRDAVDDQRHRPDGAACCLVRRRPGVGRRGAAHLGVAPAGAGWPAPRAAPTRTGYFRRAACGPPASEPRGADLVSDRPGSAPTLPGPAAGWSTAGAGGRRRLGCWRCSGFGGGGLGRRGRGFGGGLRGGRAVAGGLFRCGLAAAE